jgi:hypothetical protein
MERPERRWVWPAELTTPEERITKMRKHIVRALLTTAAVAVSSLALCAPALAVASSPVARAAAHYQGVAVTRLTALTGQVRNGLPLQSGPATHIVVPSGLPAVRGAVVSIPRLGLTTTTNSAGDFAFTGLHASPGTTYALVVTKKGFGRWTESGIRLLPGDPAQVYVELHTSAMTLHAPAPARQGLNGPAVRRAVPANPGPATSGGCTSNSSGWTSQTEQPALIRVYITGFHGPTDEGDIIDYDFSFYEQHVLPNEWISSWELPALEAGSVAVRDYAWYFIVNGSKGTAYGSPDPCSFDVDDSTGYQDFDPWAPTYTSTNTAVNDTEYYLYTESSAIPETSFNSGSSSDTCGQDDGVSETGVMSQWGSQACAQDGDSWQQILSTYYGLNLSVYGSRTPAVATDKFGNIFAFWENQNADLEEADYSAASDTWNGPVEVNGGMGPLGSSPAVATGPQSSGGYAYQYVFWRGDDGDLKEAFWNGSWNGPVDLGDGPLASAPTAGVDSSGNEYVFWESGSGNLEETEWNGSSWGAAHEISGMGPLGSSPTVAVAADGDQYVFWEGTNGDLWEAFWNGSSWNGPTDRGDGTLGSPPTAGVDGSGNEYVFWESGSGNLEETQWNGSSWGAAHAISGMGPLGSAPAVAVASGGDQYVFWKGTGDADLWEASWNGSSWNGPADEGDGQLG